MTGRIVTPEEAGGLLRDHRAYRQRRSLGQTRTDLEAVAPDLAYTVEQYGQRIAAVDALRLVWDGDHEVTYTAAEVSRLLACALRVES